jgi:hypothetical protein
MPPPYPELMWPSSLLNAYTLALSQRVEVAGRRALRITATPAPGVWRAGEYQRPERIEVIADAETGMLLRFEEFFRGRAVQLSELTDVTFEPADEFTIPGDADDDGARPESPPLFSGPGWAKARTAVKALNMAVNVLGPVLGPAIRHAPRWLAGAPADDDADDAEAAMPPAGARFDPLVSGSPASDGLLHALYNSGRAAFTATLHQWLDGAAIGEQAGTWAARHGWGGVGPVTGALGDRVGSRHQVTQVALAGDGRYRLDFLRGRRAHGPKAVGCDGTRRWQEYDDRVIVGPMLPLEQGTNRGREIAAMVDTAVLLPWHLSSVAETEVAGRLGLAVRSAVDEVPPGLPAWPPPDCDVVVDAELGIVLRMTWHRGDEQVMRYEFRDVAPLPADGTEFTLDVPPGIRVQHTDGGQRAPGRARHPGCAMRPVRCLSITGRFCYLLSCGGVLSRRSKQGPAFWLLTLRSCVMYASVWFDSHLGWQAQLVAWPVSAGIVVLLTIWGRSRAEAKAPPAPGAGELLAVELPESGRTSELSAATPVRAAGTVTLRDTIRNSRQAGRWHPAGDPEADRKALLAGQAFRVAALRRNDRRWGRGRVQIGGQPLAVTWERAALPLAGPGWAREARSLPLALPSTIVLTRPVDVARDRFPQLNDRLYTVVTIRTPDGQETLAIPTIDVPLVHAALELASAEVLVG